LGFYQAFINEYMNGLNLLYGMNKMRISLSVFEKWDLDEYENEVKKFLSLLFMDIKFSPITFRLN